MVITIVCRMYDVDVYAVHLSVMQ